MFYPDSLLNQTYSVQEVVTEIPPVIFDLYASFLLDAFILDPIAGLVRSRRLLQSSERFNLTVVATDQGRPPLWGTADLIISVIDVNDNRPVFVRPANGTIIHISEVSEIFLFTFYKPFFLCSP